MVYVEILDGSLNTVGPIVMGLGPSIYMALLLLEPRCSCDSVSGNIGGLVKKGGAVKRERERESPICFLLNLHRVGCYSLSLSPL